MSFFLSFFFFFFCCPFGQSKMRQFAIVWLPSQSSCMWHCVHHTPLCGTIHASLFPPLQVFLAQHGGPVWLWTKKNEAKLGFNWMTTCFSQLVLGRVTFLKHKNTSVYHHSGPFIHKLAVLIQLRESSWTIQKWDSGSSVNGRRDVLCCVLPEGGARHTSALNFTCVKRGSDDWSLPGDVTPFVLC